MCVARKSCEIASRRIDKSMKSTSIESSYCYVNRLILLTIGLRHIWHSLNASAHFEQALWPHRNATFHAFSRQIEHIRDSSSCSIRYRNSLICSASIDSSRCLLISAPPEINNDHLFLPVGSSKKNHTDD